MAEEESPGEIPGEMLLYSIEIRCYLKEDGEEVDALRISVPGEEGKLPPYKSVVGSMGMAQQSITELYIAADE